MTDTGTLQVALEKFYKWIQEVMLHPAAAAADSDDDIIVVAKAGTAERHYSEEQRHSTQHREDKGVGGHRDTEKWLGNHTQIDKELNSTVFV